MAARRDAARHGRELTLEVLRGAELALRHKLRRRFSPDFIQRHADDLIAQAAKEYATALEGGKEIRNPGGFIVDVAYKRALDALGKESRAPEFDELDNVAPIADSHSPQPLEEVEHREERSQLYEAIAHLDADERRVLALVYFEGISGREAAGPLGVSESTSLRRLRSAQDKLREWLPAIEAGRFCEAAAPQLRALSEGTATDRERIQAGLHLRNCSDCREAFAQRQEFAFEVGLAAWLSVATVQADPSHLGDQLVAVAQSIREAAAGLIDRARDTFGRVASSGGTEALGGAVSGPLGKTAAACGAAVLACAVTGVVGPGVGGVDIVERGRVPPAPKKRIAAPVPADTRHVVPTPESTSAHNPTDTHAARSRRKRRSAPRGSGSSRSNTSAPENSAESQFGVEAGSATGSTEGSVPTPTPVAPAGSSPNQASNRQFGLP
jgi:RNA polymerase sigma factor (sigma-70 family)